MRNAFFDDMGRTLAIADGVIMGPPTDTAFEAEVALEDTVNDIYFDIVTGAVKARLPFDLTIQRNKISGIPAGTTAFIGDFELVNDGEIEFIADVEETLRVSLDHPHYLFQNVNVETGP